MENFVLSSKLLISRSHGSRKQWTTSLYPVLLASSFFCSKRLNNPVPCSVFLTCVCPSTEPDTEPTKNKENEDGLFEAKVSLQPQKFLSQVASHNLLPRPRFLHPLLSLPVPPDFPSFGIPISWESDITRTSKPTSDFNCSRTCSRTTTCSTTPNYSGTCSRTTTCSRNPNYSGTCSRNWRSTISHRLKWVLGSYLLTPLYNKNICTCIWLCNPAMLLWILFLNIGCSTVCSWMVMYVT